MKTIKLILIFILISNNAWCNNLEFKKPKEISNYMKNSFDFKDDYEIFNKSDYWQSPEEFLKNKKGDCEDYAIFSNYFLNKIGYNSFIISFYGLNNFAHTVTIYEENNKFNAFNEDRLYKYQSDTIEETLTKIYPFWTWGAFATRKNGKGFALKKFKNNY
jgi:hypothetical protein